MNKTICTLMFGLVLLWIFWVTGRISGIDYRLWSLEGNFNGHSHLSNGEILWNFKELNFKELK